MKLSRRGLFKALGGLGLAALVGKELPLEGTPISGNLVNGVSHVNSFGTLNIGSGAGGAGAQFIPEIWSREVLSNLSLWRLGDSATATTSTVPLTGFRRLRLGHYQRVKRE